MDITGSRFRILLQRMDELGQPAGSPEIVFTGDIDNISFRDEVAQDQVVSVISVEITNKFTLRNMTSGSVLSDVDQRARSSVLNPSAPADQFCVRVPLMRDKTIKWPSW